MKALGQPFETYIVKVVSYCNLNCSYCYEYNKGDETWKTVPRSMPLDTVRLVGRRIEEHAMTHGLTSVYVTAHGGEAMLYGAERLDAFYTTLRAEVSPRVQLRCGGGYFPTRYRTGTGYQNPSVYCNDLKVLLSGIREYVHHSLGLPVPTRVEPQPQVQGRRVLALIEIWPGDPGGHDRFLIRLRTKSSGIADESGA